MSYEVLKDGWFGWNMPAWIECGDGSALQRCRIRDIEENHAKLEVDRARELPDKFLLHLAASGNLPLECRVITRQPTTVEIEFSRREPECSPIQRAGCSSPVTATENRSPACAKSSGIASRYRARQELEAQKGTAVRRRTRRRAIANALVVSGLCASLLFVLAVILDWGKMQSSTYQLAGSTSHVVPLEHGGSSCRQETETPERMCSLPMRRP